MERAGSKVNILDREWSGPNDANTEILERIIIVEACNSHDSIQECECSTHASCQNIVKVMYGNGLRVPETSVESKAKLNDAQNDDEPVI